MTVVALALFATACASGTEPSTTPATATTSTSRTSASAPSTGATSATTSTAATTSTTATTTTTSEPPRPHGVVLFVADGMGPAQVEALRRVTDPFFDDLPITATMTTSNATGDITDSAASATAMATGVKVSNRVLSVRIPGDGEPLTTNMEILERLGYHTGLVTTAPPLTDATPAAFVAHTPDRGDTAAIVEDMVQVNRPDILMGPRSGGLDEAGLGAAGYRTVTDAASVDLDEGPVAWLHTPGVDPPSLAEMATAAVRALDAGGTGFFVVIEHEGPDNAGHINDLAGVLDALREFDAAVAAVADLLGDRDDVAIIVLGDHETGGLELLDGEIEPGLPRHRYTTRHHTGVPVWVFARGVVMPSEIDNTDIFRIVLEAAGAMAFPDPSGAGGS